MLKVEARSLSQVSEVGMWPRILSGSEFRVEAAVLPYHCVAQTESSPPCTLSKPDLCCVNQPTCPAGVM